MKDKILDYLKSVPARLKEFGQRKWHDTKHFFPRMRQKITGFSLRNWWQGQLNDIKETTVFVRLTLRRITWLRATQWLLLMAFVWFVAFYLINQQVLNPDTYDLTQGFQSLKQFFIFPYALSLLGIAYFVSRNVNWKYLIKLGLGYLLYLLGSYWIYASRNLNDENFRFWDWGKNNFWQGTALPSLLLILLLALGYQYLVRYISRNGYATVNKRRKLYPRWSLASLLALPVLTDERLISVLNDSAVSTIGTEISLANFGDYFWLILQLTLGILLAAGILWVAVIQAMSDVRRNQTSFALSVTSSILYALIFNYYFQFSIRSDGALFGRYIYPAATIFQICVLFIFASLLYAVINRYLLTSLILTIMGVSLTFANSMKMSMRSEPVLFSDLSWLTDLGQIIGYVTWGAVVGVFIGFAALVIIYSQLKKRFFREKLTKSKSLRLSVVILSLLLFSLSLYSFRQQKDGKISNNVPILSKLNNWINIDFMGMANVARQKSLMFVWIKQMALPAMEAPEGYSREKMAAIAQKYRQEAENINQTRTENISDQTVIFVLSESLSDPSRVPGVALSHNIIPEISTIKNEYTGGLMKSDGYGGGTANMEFQALTGLPKYNLSTSVSTMMTEVGLSMKKVPSISDLWQPKDRIAIHLTDASTYSRDSFYKKLGFDKFIALENGNSKLLAYETRGTYANDESTYMNVTKSISSNSNEGQFFSVISIQNHAPWTYQDDSDIDAHSDNLSDSQNEQLKSYAKLLKQTDAATKGWLDQLSQIDKKITVVFYGDHLPGIYPTTSFTDNPGSQYQTDYFIWTNYEKNKLDYPYVNSSDFPAELLAVTNSKVSPYYALLTQVLNNASVDKTDLTAEQQEIANDLKYVEYDLTSGEGYLSNDQNFFQIGR